MRHLFWIAVAMMAQGGCGSGQSVAPRAGESRVGAPPAPAAPVGAAKPGVAVGAPGERNEFVLRGAKAAGEAADAGPSSITATKTEAAIRFIVIDKDKGPVQGVVISLSAPDGSKHYTEETDAEGRAEVLVPVGQKYEVVYLSLGRRDIAATVSVSAEPKQNIKLTLRYKRFVPPPTPVAEAPAAPRFVLSGITFDTGKATLRPESFPRLDAVIEYLTHKKSARIEISGHTDNVGNPKTNKALSEKRAQACRAYLMGKGIDGDRLVALGHGDERPIAPNDTDEGRQKNRRIEATEL